MNRIDIRLSHLLGLYLLLPLVWAIVWLDEYRWGLSLRLMMPFRPELWVVWVYLFGMPHVVASIQTLADREYLEHYGWRLGRVFAFFLVLPLVVSAVFGTRAMFAIYMMYIVYHTVVQQWGLTIVALRSKPDFTFQVWKWSAIALGLNLYAMLYSEPFPIALGPNQGLRNVMVAAAETMAALSVLAALVLCWKHRGNRLGMGFIVANTAMVLTDLMLFMHGYYALIVMLSRVIHEFTAWPIYAAHDHNRNLEGRPNFIYRVLAATRVPVFWLSILLAFALGLFVTYAATEIVKWTSVVISLSLIHFHMESFLWRRDTIHRRHLQFSR